MSSFIRTFVAVPIALEVGRETARLIQRLQGSAAKVKWADAHHLHFTLKFLGDVRMTDIRDVCSAVEAACQGHGPIDVSVGNVGAFPDEKRPRTIWIGMTEGAHAVAAIQAAIDQKLQPLGFRPEGRQFHPHATIGRVREGFRGDGLPELLQKHREFSAGEMTVSQVVVYSSELKPEGPVYASLATVKLET